MSSSERYLDSPEYAFISTMLWMSRWSNALLEPYGLQGVHMHVMARLDEAPGLTQNELAERIHRDAPATSRVLDEMDGKGLIERRMDPADRRRRRIHLTRKGSRLFAELHAGFRRERQRAGVELDARDVQALWRVAGRLQQCYRNALVSGAHDHEREAG